MVADPPQVQSAAQTCPWVVPAHDAGQLPLGNERVGADAQLAAARQAGVEGSHTGNRQLLLDWP